MHMFSVLWKGVTGVPAILVEKTISVTHERENTSTNRQNTQIADLFETYCRLLDIWIAS